jgi:two-component system response regulator AtoC
MEVAQKKYNDLMCIILTAYGDVDLAVQAMKKGAVDFMTKPINLDKLEILLKRLLQSQKIEIENRTLKEQLDVQFGMDNIIGKSSAMQQVFEMIRQVSQSRATVLIQGESGTGKELVAKAIHQLSPRSKSEFVPVHCAALAENLLESELFGHEKGAFTGATERRIGRFEKASSGSLFLDEISEINSSVQVKILRALEERQIERVGGNQLTDVDVRLIAATNRDLQSMVEQGDFREDLFYRLYVVVINLPALRERGDDILLLLNHYLKIFNEENNKNIKGFSSDAYDILSKYNWPGNIRELRNLVERMVVLCQTEIIDVENIPSHVRLSKSDMALISSNESLTVEEMEKEMIIKSLKKTDGNITKAADNLGMSRRTLHRKINKLGLSRKVIDLPEEEKEQ